MFNRLIRFTGFCRFLFKVACAVTCEIYVAHMIRNAERNAASIVKELEVSPCIPADAIMKMGMVLKTTADDYPHAYV